MRRREFIVALGGAAITQLMARGQQTDRVRRIGALITSSLDDPESQAVVGAFSQGLQALGWTLGRNVRIEYRWAPFEDERVRRTAAELVAIAPDIIMAMGGTAVRALQQAT